MFFIVFRASGLSAFTSNRPGNVHLKLLYPPYPGGGKPWTPGRKVNMGHGGPAARLRLDQALKALYRTDGADMPQEAVFWTIPPGER